MSRIAEELIAPFVIEVDDHQFTVIELVTISNAEKSTRVGEVRESTKGYFSNLGTALKKIAKLKTLNLQQKFTIEEYIETHNAYLKEFSDKVNL